MSSSAVVGGRLTQQAYDRLRTSILRGDLAAGTPLTEQTCAAKLGMSKTPVRHALRSLLDEGLLQPSSRRRLMVRGFSAEHRDELVAVRESLERVALIAACRSMRIEDVDYLRILLLRQRRAIEAFDEERFIDLDEDLHLRIAEGAHLHIVPKLLGQLRGFVRVMRLGTVRSPGHLSAVLREHEAIVDALEQRDEETAVAALARHLHTSDYS